MINDQIPSVKNKCLSMCKNKGYRNNQCRSNKKKVNTCSNLKPQPGNYAYNKGYGTNKKIYQCPNMIEKVLKDNYNVKKGVSKIKLSKFNERCPRNYYKGAMVVDPNNTYHFYRQDDNIRYSHKQGTLRVENIDASKNPIYVPHLADKNYNKNNRSNGINYTNFCTYFCIPKNNYLDTHAM